MIDNDKPLHFDRLVIAAYRLPFKFVKHNRNYKAIQNSGGLVSAILSLSENFKTNNKIVVDNKIVWAGISEDLPKNISSHKLDNEHFDVVPIDISPKLNDLYYGGFCNNLIWPLFHYFPSYSVFNSEYFNAYQEANQKFCDELIEIIKPGDFVWIHDYQLMLLPEMIRQRVPDATIGFFLHIPFPSFELFRLLPRRWRDAIVNGVLGADLVGFHTTDYTQHFIKCVKRTLGYENYKNIIYTPNRLVKADTFPIGIDFNKFQTACNSANAKTEKDKIRKLLKSQKLIFSVDRLDYTKGILPRLRGYETFLEKYPHWRKKVVFNMVIIPSRDSIKKYRDMKKGIELAVGRINGKYSTLSWRPIIYQYKSLSFDALVALYDMSDVGLITPFRDGMNLVAKEYVACQIENKGVLILSEMAGAVTELSESLIINPADDIEMAEAICKALEMETSEKLRRLSSMQKTISNYNVFTWAFHFFDETFDLKLKQNLLNAKIINNDISAKIALDYKNSKKRIFLLDYDGTLAPFAKYPELSSLDDNTIRILKKLTDDPKNKVVIISGRDKESLEKQFKDLNVLLVAEHGYFVKKFGNSWKATSTADLKWKKIVMPILNEYVTRCGGSFIEEKTASLAWHYRNADTDFAQQNLDELRDDINDIIRHIANVEILQGNKVFEIKGNDYNKGQATNNLIKDSSFDFILAAGDDKTDEYLFRALPEAALSIRVGMGHTTAKYIVDDIPRLLKILNSISY